MAASGGLLDRLGYVSPNFREPGEPPEADVVASLGAAVEPSEYGGALDPDPLPPTAKPARKTTKRTPSKPNVSAATRKRLVDEIELYLMMAGTGWSMRCEACGGKLEERAKVGAEAIVSMIMRSEWLLAKVETTSLMADVFKLVHAFGPVAMTAIRHSSEHVHHQHDEALPPGQWNDYPAYRPQ